MPIPSAQRSTEPRTEPSASPIASSRAPSHEFEGGEPSLIESGVHAVERRRDRRIAFEVDVTIESDGQRYPGIARDLSLGGVFVFTFREVPPGAKVVVGFPVLQHYVRTEASARWNQRGAPGVIPGIALEFDTMSEQVRSTLSRVCTAE